MATLFERLIGDIPGGDTDTKIAIHGFQTLLQEVAEGHVSGAEAAAALDLTPAQASDAQALFTVITNSSDPRGTAALAFRLLVMGELDYPNLPQYKDQATFVSRLQANG